MKKKLLAISLFLCMLLSLLPTMVFAVDEDSDMNMAVSTDSSDTKNDPQAESEPQPENDPQPEGVVFPTGVTVSTFGENTVTDGVNYYATLFEALQGIHLTENKNLYCKPGANVGIMTHGHVCADLTIYGNGAKLTAAGEQDFELDTYKTECDGLTNNLALEVVDLEGCGAWGQHTTPHTLNIIFKNCKNMNRVYLTGTSGSNNITLENCSFLGSLYKDSPVYSNANGKITLSNVVFENMSVPINLNHKAAGMQEIWVSNCSFSNCGNPQFEYAAPIRVLSSVEGGSSILTINNCTFTDTKANKNGQQSDILLDFGAGATSATISGTEAKVIAELAENIGETVSVAKGENKTFSTGLVGEGTSASPYLISSLDELKMFRDSVNNGKTYAKKYIQLTDDIDLGSEEWTPIGIFDKFPFQGTFDGNGHTIRNLQITGKQNNVGLFGYTQNGEIKNLTIENALVSGYLNVGVVAGTPHTSKYTNITVKGHVEVNGMSYVGGVGGKNAYADWTNIIVQADETSYVNAVSTEYDPNSQYADENGYVAYRTYVGGVIGFNGEGGHTFKNISSNIAVTGDVQDVGGVFGIAHYNNKFENITCTGAVTNTNSTYPLAETETGGIAGVWYNEKGTSVSFTGCSFTGTVTVNGETVPSNDLTGGAYIPSNHEDNNSGSLIVDGERVWPLVAEVGGKSYGTLQAAFDTAKDGDTVTVLCDITITPMTAAYNEQGFVDGVRYNGDASFTVDFNGHTITDDGCVNDYLLYMDNMGNKANEITFKNGIVVSKSGCWSTVCVGKNASSQKTVLNLDGMTITNKNGITYQGNEAVRVRGSASVPNTVNVNAGTVITSDAASYGIVCSSDGAVVNINTGAKVEQKNSGTTSGNNVYSAVGGKGVINIYEGAEILSDNIGVHTMTTGTPVVNIYGGTIIAAGTALVASTNGGEDQLATINVYGGIIEGALKETNSDSVINVSGGSFTEDPTAYLADGYQAPQTPDGKYSVSVAPNVTMVAQINNGVKYQSLDAAFAAAKDGDTVKILEPGTYELNTSGKDITITGTVADVVFDNIGSKNMGGANVTFHHVTFDYYPKTDYTGLQHAGNLVYQECTFNGQVFLYGISETFIKCTFNQDSADAYNVWTYGADKVTFEDCTFNSAGKSVLVYNEGDGPTALTVNGCKFNATSSVNGKAAIEIDTSSPNKPGAMDGTTITIDSTTTATGFGTGSFSGNSLWNDKMNLTNLEVHVADKQVWPLSAATIDHGFQTIIDADKSRETITTTLKDVYAANSLVVKIYSNDTLLGTTTLREHVDGDPTQKLYPAKGEYTVNNVITGVKSSSWETVWAVKLTRKNLPTKIEVYADGKLTDTFENANGCFLDDTEKTEYIELFDLTYTVTFATNGGSFVATQEVVTGEKAVKPEDPTRNGYTFKGWYSDSALTTEFSFDTAITADTTIYAKWLKDSSSSDSSSSSRDEYIVSVDADKHGTVTVNPKRADKGDTVTVTVKPDDGYELNELTVTDKHGNTVKLKDKGNGKFTFTMPGSKVTVEASFKPIETEPEAPTFVDVPADAYYADAVAWAVKQDITTGTSATTFSPDASCTRAQMVTFLWRANGSPKATGANPFNDVSADAYYYDAVLWAAEKGITTGTTATTFSPDAVLTRGQTVTFLWRANGSPVVNYAMNFADVDGSIYYAEAVRWAVAEGITTGTGGNTFSPDADCTRAQIVTLMYRGAQ